MVSGIYKSKVIRQDVEIIYTMFVRIFCLSTTFQRFLFTRFG